MILSQGLAGLMGQGAGAGTGMMNSPGMQSLMQQMMENPTLMSQVCKKIESA